MVQARRKKQSKPAFSPRKPSFQGMGTLFIGMVIGSLSTILWQGMQSEDGGVGTGIRQMIESSRTEALAQVDNDIPQVDEKPQKRQTSYDFFTVLPEIEVVISDNEPTDIAPVNSQAMAATQGGGLTQLAIDNLEAAP